VVLLAIRMSLSRRPELLKHRSKIVPVWTTNQHPWNPGPMLPWNHGSMEAGKLVDVPAPYPAKKDHTDAPGCENGFSTFSLLLTRACGLGSKQDVHTETHYELKGFADLLANRVDNANRVPEAVVVYMCVSTEGACRTVPGIRRPSPTQRPMGFVLYTPSSAKPTLGNLAFA